MHDWTGDGPDDSLLLRFTERIPKSKPPGVIDLDAGIYKMDGTAISVKEKIGATFPDHHRILPRTPAVVTSTRTVIDPLRVHDIMTELRADKPTMTYWQTEHGELFGASYEHDVGTLWVAALTLVGDELRKVEADVKAEVATP